MSNAPLTQEQTKACQSSDGCWLPAPCCSTQGWQRCTDPSSSLHMLPPTPRPPHAKRPPRHSLTATRSSWCWSAWGLQPAPCTPTGSGQPCKWGATYQLVDAVDGSVVLVTQPLHAFETERERRVCQWAAMYPAFTDAEGWAKPPGRLGIPEPPTQQAARGCTLRQCLAQSGPVCIHCLLHEQSTSP